VRSSIRLVVLLAAAGITGCGHSSKATFHAQGIEFSYPKAWRLASYHEQSSFSSAVAFVSTDPMHKPCRTVSTGFGGSETTCGLAIGRLTPRGVYASWFAGVVRQNNAPRDPEVRIPGAKASVTIERPGICRRRADETITATISHIRSGIPVDPGGYTLFSCVRGPEIRKQERQVLDLLRTVRLDAAATS
jgi:hypothetical protein